jgi:hypothetical protein
MPGPKGIITVKGSFELLYLRNKEFHNMAQNFGMIANYGEHKSKSAGAATGIIKQLEGHWMEPEAKKPLVQSPDSKKDAVEEEKVSAT